MKQCSKCNLIKPYQDYYKKSDNKDGHMSYCKKCDIARRSKWNADNREKARAQDRKYYANNPEKRKQKNHIYRKNNATKIITYSRDYYYKNKKAKNEQNKKWYKEHPEKSRDKYNKRRAAKMQNGKFYVTPKFLMKLYSSNCLVCNSNSNIEMDHVIPLTRGGTHGEGNLQPLCRSCNASKGNKTMTEWKYRLRQILPS